MHSDEPSTRGRAADAPDRRGVLYVVATPIGNLEDLTPRAARILAEVDYVLAEDTRHSRRLLDHYGIRTELRPHHDHNERESTERAVDALARGTRIALISDAGTPLMSDPGFRLVREARRGGFDVRCVPGPSAVVAALSVAGVPCERFIFEGFAPTRRAARRDRFERLREEERTLVFYESPHRILASLDDAVDVFGADRPAALARELTKRFETVVHGGLADVRAAVGADPDQQRGEMVLVIAGMDRSNRATEPDDALLCVLMDELPTKQASTIAARITGRGRNEIYARMVELARHDGAQ